MASDQDVYRVQQLHGREMTGAPTNVLGEPKDRVCTVYIASLEAAGEQRRTLAVDETTINVHRQPRNAGFNC